MKPILIGFDGSALARAAIARAGELFPGATAVVLTVAEPVSTWPDHDPAGVAGTAIARAAGVVAELDEIALEVATSTAYEGAALANEAGLSATPLSLAGDPRSVIIATGADDDVGVIVLGTRGLSAAKSVLLGSVSAGVVHRCGRPVLVVPPPGW